MALPPFRWQNHIHIYNAFVLRLFCMKRGLDTGVVENLNGFCLEKFGRLDAIRILKDDNDSDGFAGKNALVSATGRSFDSACFRIIQSSVEALMCFFETC